MYSDSIGWEDGLKLVNHVRDVTSVIQNYRPKEELISGIHKFIEMVKNIDSKLSPENKQSLINYADDGLVLLPKK